MTEKGFGVHGERGRPERADYTQDAMSATAPPLLDSALLINGRRRRDRLTGSRMVDATADPMAGPTPALHPVIARAHLSIGERLADMRLPPGRGLIISPYPEWHGLETAFAPWSLVHADVFPAVEPQKPTEHKLVHTAKNNASGKRGGGRGLVRLLQDWMGGTARAGRHPRLMPSASGSYDSLENASQSFVLDTAGLIAGWPMAVWFPEMARLLKSGGVYVSASLGPTSLAGLWASLGRPVPASPFWHDLHDIGDALSAAGLASPVAESDRLTFSYGQVAKAWADIRNFPVRPRLVVDKAAGTASSVPLTRRRIQAALEAQRGADGRIALGVELVIAHAWKPEPRASKAAADGARPVTWHSRKTN